MTVQFVTSGSTVNILALREAMKLEREKFEADWKKRWEALDLVETMNRPSGNPIEFANPTQIQPTAYQPPRYNFSEAVRTAYSRMRNEFTVGDVEVWLKANGYRVPDVDPRGRIAMVLQEAKNRGDIGLTIEGSGRTPNRYKVIKQ